VISPGSGAKTPAFSVVIHEKGGGERREQFVSSEISVGRVHGNDIVLPKGNVSKRHARVLYRDGRFIVTDLNSTNGTYVNRRRITQATIVREGDKIYVGDFVLKIEPSVPSRETPEATGDAESARTTSRTDSSPPSMPAPADVGSSSAQPQLPDDPPGRPTALSLEVQTPAAASRNTPEAELSEHTEPSEVIGTLVARVAERLGARDLNRPSDANLEQSVDRLLRETWQVMEPDAGGLSGERVVGRARAELCELGPVADLLADEGVVELGVPRFDRVVVARSGRPTTVEPGFSSELALSWTIHRLCEQSGTPLRANEVSFERRLPSGATLQGSLGTGGPNGALLLIRRPRRSLHTLEDLVRRGTVSRAIVTFVQHCLVARLNLLVVGPRDGGTEALIGALAMTPVDGTPIWISEQGQPPLPGMPRVDSTQAPDRLRQAVRLAARLPGSRLMVDLTPPGLVAAVVEATGEGADGIIGSRAGTGASRTLSRLAAELAAQGGAEGLAVARELVAGSFDITVEILRLRDGRHRVVRVAEVLGAGPAGFELGDIYTFVADRTAAGGAVEGTFVSSGSVPRVADVLKSRGIQLEAALFSRPLSR
jgi:pilus assembly protein CpaF